MTAIFIQGHVCGCAFIFQWMQKNKDIKKNIFLYYNSDELNDTCTIQLIYIHEYYTYLYNKFLIIHYRIRVVFENNFHALNYVMIILNVWPLYEIIWITHPNWICSLHPTCNKCKSYPFLVNYKSGWKFSISKM